MATSGLTNFNLSVDEILEEAFGYVGGEYTSAEEARKARRSLNLVLRELENKGVPLANLEERSFTVTQGDRDVTLDADVIDVLDVRLQRDSTDFGMNRKPLLEYSRISRKDSQGRPTTYAIERDINGVVMYIYLAPENSTDVIYYWALTRIENVTRSHQNVDLVPRYLPAIVYGLAHKLSFGREGVDAQKRNELYTLYQQTLMEAQEEDRERTSLILAPKLSRV